jgi:hypothetical protein
MGQIDGDAFKRYADLAQGDVNGQRASAGCVVELHGVFSGVEEP